MHPTSKMMCIALAMAVIMGTMHGVNSQDAEVKDGVKAVAIDIPPGVKPPSNDAGDGTQAV